MLTVVFSKSTKSGYRRGDILEAFIVFRTKALECDYFFDERIAVRVVRQALLIEITCFSPVVSLFSENPFCVERKVSGVVCAEGEKRA